MDYALVPTILEKHRENGGLGQPVPLEQQRTPQSFSSAQVCSRHPFKGSPWALLHS